ncbi:phosphoglycerate kinase [Candidatus Dojkabacteria bacterium]|uniref:Phosphoglycerate kinase n=1 Tax=Candidatus Dojkabacteria bacterium TaxID=2099670 RepID=A0A3M0YYU4_9BACT|nr:MAG: phosphoglycerate kinase [Candidatus Dojkabacteria bacterium]
MYKIPSNIEKKGFWNVDGLENKNVFLRSCLNVSVDKYGNLLDESRLKESIQSIVELAFKSKSLIVCGHLGRPKSCEQNLSFKKNVLPWITENLNSKGFNVIFAESLSDIPPKDQRNKSNIYLLENIRFFKGEESNDRKEMIKFAESLAETSDIFVNDAFADYRVSASTYEIAKLLPSYIGRSFMKEIEALSKFYDPPRPFLCVLGGAKLSEKLEFLTTLAEISDKVLIGGAMAYTLLKAKGINIGKSLYEEDKVSLARELIKKHSQKMLLPVDHVISLEFSHSSQVTVTKSAEVPNEYFAIDIGPKTLEKYLEEISNAKSILWNGPMGVYEWPQSSTGTSQIGESIVKNKEAFKLAGGGDTIAAINMFSLSGFDHISMGGGAMLVFFSCDKFDTIDVIVNQYS